MCIIYRGDRKSTRGLATTALRRGLVKSFASPLSISFRFNSSAVLIFVFKMDLWFFF